MFCSNCGTKLDDGAIFCSKCGARVGGAAPEAAPAETPAPTPAAAPTETPAPTPAAAPTAPTPVAPAQQAPAPKKKLWIPITATAAAIALIGGGVGGFLYLKSPSRLYAAAMSKGEASLDEKEYKDAIKHYLEAKKIDDSKDEADDALYDAYVKYAKKLEKDGDLEEAAAQYENALEIKKKKATVQALNNVYLQIAYELYQKGKLDDALEYAYKVLEEDPGNYNAVAIVNNIQYSSVVEESSEAGQPSEGSVASSVDDESSSEEDIVVSSKPVTLSQAPLEDSGYHVFLDANGNVYDFGGMEIIIRDWWSSDDEQWPRDEYEECTLDYRNWIQETYNFKIKRIAISDWGSAPQDFADYVANEGDDKNYVFLLRNDPATTYAMYNGLCYDLSTLDCLDFTQPKFQRNLTHKEYAKDGKIFGMSADYAEPRTGVFFNKRLLQEAGIDPESIYDMQLNGSWTWEAFVSLCDQLKSCGIAPCDCNDSMMTEMAVFSNDGEFIGMDENGKYVYKLEDPKTLEGLNFAADLFDQYWLDEPEDAAWDYYKQAFLDGQYAFMFEQAYNGKNYGFLSNDPYTYSEMEDDWGFVMFPKGPAAKDYVNVWEENVFCIPACYNAERAWKIAFAWNLYTNETPGFEDSNVWKTEYYNGFDDKRSVDETIAMMRVKGKVTYHRIVPGIDIGNQFTWLFGPMDLDYQRLIDVISGTWQAYIDEANN